MDIPHDLSGRVEATCKWLESGTSVFTTDMAHDIRARIAELEAKVASSLTEQRRLLADARAWRKTSEQAEAALAELREVERFARMAVDGDVDESAKGWMLLRDALTDLRAEEGGE